MAWVKSLIQIFCTAVVLLACVQKLCQLVKNVECPLVWFLSIIDKGSIRGGVKVPLDITLMMEGECYCLMHKNTAHSTYLALRSSGTLQDNGQQEFALCFCL